MSQESHLKELERKHRVLDEKIAAENRHPAADEVALKRMKHDKLKLKEEIERLRAEAA